MRILFLTQFFDPEPFFKALPFARELVRRGHDVEVLTGFPNYPGGKLYPGYKIRFVTRELLDGVRVIRVPLYPSHDRSPIKRILNYVSFAVSASLLGPFVVKKADVAYVYHPPPTVGLPAIVLRLVRGIRFVYDIQDLWPDSLQATGMIRRPGLLSMVGRWCSFIYCNASKVVVLSEGFKERLISRHVPSGKIQVVYNWAPEETTAAVLPGTRVDWPFGSEKFTVLFAGNMGPAQALDCVLATAKLIEHTSPDVQFVFLGDGISADRLKNSAKEKRLGNVTFLPRVSPAEAVTLLQKANALLVHLKKDPLFSITIPSKTQAYLAAGKPILIGIAGDAATLVRAAHAGVAFEPEDAASMARAIQELQRLTPQERFEMGENGRRFYETNLSRAAAVEQFEQIFSSVAAGPSD